MLYGLLNVLFYWAALWLARVDHYLWTLYVVWLPADVAVVEEKIASCVSQHIGYMMHSQKPLVQGAPPLPPESISAGCADLPTTVHHQNPLALIA